MKTQSNAEIVTIRTEISFYNNIFKENELIEKSNVHFLHNAISGKQ